MSVEVFYVGKAFVLQGVAMSYETVKCDSCGASLGAFNEYANRGVCPFCGAIIRKVEGMDEVEKALRKAYDLRDKIGDEEKAKEAAREFASLHPGDFRAWKMDYEFNANREIGAAYYPRPVAVERMCRTAEDAIDRQYLQSVAKDIGEDKQKLEKRISEIADDAKEVEKQGPKAGAGDWRPASEADLFRLDKEIEDLNARISDLSRYDVASMSSYAQGFAIICGILLTMTLVGDGCSRGGFASVYNGIVLGPLGGLLFGAPVGALVGVVVAFAVNNSREAASKRASAQERSRLEACLGERQSVLVELGRASEVGELKERVDCLRRSVAEIDYLLGIIGDVV
ncbi:MAG: hypothetical protein IJ111_05535 [Eggerthellaceae bacterium]|nr:hypothetical protein [Eggerthellaceae bacterium]